MCFIKLNLSLIMSTLDLVCAYLPLVIMIRSMEYHLEYCVAFYNCFVRTNHKHVMFLLSNSRVQSHGDFLSFHDRDIMYFIIFLSLVILL